MPNRQPLAGVRNAGLGPLPLAEVTSANDPTNLHGLALTGPWVGGCVNPVVATSTIVWSMAPLYPDLVGTDTGDTGGARGTVTVETGVPVSYVVNHGDVIEEVAARFSITAAELVWLNSWRNSRELTVFKDETLNLSPSRR